MRRFRGNKRSSVRKFRRNINRTKSINLAPPPMRGGFRI